MSSATTRAPAFERGDARHAVRAAQVEGLAAAVPRVLREPSEYGISRSTITPVRFRVATIPPKSRSAAALRSSQDVVLQRDGVPTGPRLRFRAG